jgi:hypothetical protein
VVLYQVDYKMPKYLNLFSLDHLLRILLEATNFLRRFSVVSKTLLSLQCHFSRNQIKIFFEQLAIPELL